MAKNPLISVLIPAYNHECYIEETIRSIIAQTYENLELIILDDGSTDATFEKINSLKPESLQRFVRIDFSKTENKGVIRALNTLIDKASGEYVYMIASDDVSKPDAVTKLYSFLSDNPEYVLAVGDSEIIDARSNRIYWDKDRNSVPKEEAIDQTFGSALHIMDDSTFGTYKKLLKNNNIPNGFLVSKESLLKAGKYSPDALLEDWYMNLQLAKQGKMKFIPEILFSYRWHQKNTVKSLKYTSLQRDIFRQILLLEKKYCFENGHKKLWKTCWSRRFGVRYYFKKIRNFIRRKK